MKIQLTYERPAHIDTELLVVILDENKTFYDLSGSPIGEIVRRVERDIEGKKLKTSYFTALDAKLAPKHLLVHSTSLNRTFNVWESLKTLVAKSLRVAQDHGFSRIAFALNTNDAAAFVGKAVEGIILGGYTFDRYKQEKSKADKLRIQLAVLEDHEESNKQKLSRYTLVSNAINEARDLINEPGGVVNPEYMAEAARKVADRYGVMRLVHAEHFERIDEAIAREKAIKKWRRAWKLELIERENPDWSDLFEHIIGA